MKYLILIFIGLYYSTSLMAQVPLSSAFTYQGELQFYNKSANGRFDFTFRLFDAASSGNQVGSDLVIIGAIVNNGIITQNLDFGVNAFSGDEVWLEVSVKQTTDTGPYTLLSPRKLITSTPYAIHAQFVGANAVSSIEIQNNSILAADIAAGAVGSSEIAAGAVGNQEIFKYAVDASKIADNAVGSSKIADNAVGSSEIAANAVGSSEIAYGAVDTSEIKVNAVRLSSLNGAELKIYRLPFACSADSRLSTISTCYTRICSGLIYYGCDNSCGTRVIPDICNTTFHGYILSPSIN